MDSNHRYGSRSRTFLLRAGAGRLAAATLLCSVPAPVEAATITEFTVPSGGGPLGITPGPDGALWFIEGIGKVGRVTTAGAVTEFPIPTPISDATFITAGPDGALWFAERSANQIGRITTAGAATEFAVTTKDSQPTGITAGPDGALWFAEANADKIGRITTAGVISEFPIPTANSQPQGIAVGPDGNLWFTEVAGNKIGRITPTGVITEFPIPTANSQPVGITAGADGALWFVERNGNQVGRITTGGAISELPIPTANSQPQSIAAGPDGNLWFTERATNKIGRVSGLSVSLSVSASVNQSTFTVGQTLVGGGSVTDPGLPGSADFYIGILGPNNTIEFFTSTGSVFGNVADLTSFRPIAVNFPLSTPFSVNEPSFITRQRAAGDLTGGYVLFIAAVKAGALADGIVTNDEILGLGTASYSFP